MIVTSLGIIASLLVLLSQIMPRMVSLRCFALASNVAFISYGAVGYFGFEMPQVVPILLLHLVLAPINSIRLTQAVRQAISRKPQRSANARLPDRSENQDGGLVGCRSDAVETRFDSHINLTAVSSGKVSPSIDYAVRVVQPRKQTIRAGRQLMGCPSEFRRRGLRPRIRNSQAALRRLSVPRGFGRNGLVRPARYVGRFGSRLRRLAAR
jgi:hypothetical protein